MKKKIVIGIIVLLIILVVAYKFFFLNGDKDSNIQTTETIYTVAYGTLKDSIEIVGNAGLVDEQQLSFKIAGTITKVNFKEGDKVRKGEIIAEIDNTDALNTIQDAEISLENARINLKELYKGPNQSNILSSQNSITNAENSLATAQKELENLKISQENAKNKALQDLDNSKKDLDTAKINLEILKKEKDQSFGNTLSSKNTTIKNTEDSFKSYLLEIEKINTDADYVLGISEENSKKNDDFEIYLGAKDYTYKNEATTLLSKSIFNLNTLKTVVNDYDYSGNRDVIIGILNQFSNAYNDIYDMTDALYRTAEYSVESAGRLSQSDIDSIKNSASSSRSTALSKISSITSTINSLNNLSDTELLASSNANSIASQELSISKQEASLINSVKSYEELLASQKITLTSKINDVESKKKSLEVARLNYEELMEGPTEENISKANNSIRQAQIKLDNAYKNLEDYMLIAPFDGIIKKVDYMVGDNLKNDTNKYIQIENPDLVEITVNLDQIDIVNVAVGSDAIITFDAYPTIPAKAEVSLVDTTPVSTSGVVSYQVKLVLNDENFNKTILSGMTADVEIITKQKENVLVVRGQAISNRGGKNIVTVEENGTRREVEVEIGMTTSNMTEIVSGLKEGDKVVGKSVIITGSSSDSTTTRQQNFPVGGAVRTTGGGGGTMMGTRG